MEQKNDRPDRKERRATDLYLLEEEIRDLKHESVSEFLLVHDLSSTSRAAEEGMKASMRKTKKRGGFLRSIGIAAVFGGLTGVPAIGVAVAAMMSSNGTGRQRANEDYERSQAVRDAASAAAANARRSVSQKEQRRKALEEVRNPKSWLPEAINHYGQSLIFLVLLAVPIALSLLATAGSVWLSVVVFFVGLYIVLSIWGSAFSPVISAMKDYSHVRRRKKSSLVRRPWYRFVYMTVLLADIAGVCGWLYLTVGVWLKDS